MSFIETSIKMLNNISDYEFYSNQIINKYKKCYELALNKQTIVICGFSPFARDIAQRLKVLFDSDIYIVDSGNETTKSFNGIEIKDNSFLN